MPGGLAPAKDFDCWLALSMFMGGASSSRYHWDQSMIARLRRTPFRSVVFLAVALAAAGITVTGAAKAGAGEVTYTKDIAPILWKNCAACHRPGEVGPFSLLTYKDA